MTAALVHIPVSGDLIPTGWAESEVWPALATIDEFDAVADVKARCEAIRAYQETRQRDSLEAVKAIRFCDLRMAVILGPAEMGQRTDLEPTSAQVGSIDRNRRVYLRLLLDAFDEIRALIAEADTTDDISDRQLANLARAYRREHTPATPADDATGDGWEIRAGDFRDVLTDVGDGTVDLVLTDPPYPAEDLPLWTDLGRFAARVLGPRGLLIAYTGSIFLPEVLARLGEHLTYGWTYCLDLRAGSRSRIMGRHVLQTWKPIVAFSTGTWPSGRWHDDLVISPAPDKELHGWQQAALPAQRLIEALTPPDGMIVDPFTGAGTFGVASRTSGRRFVGAELDPKVARRASTRLAEL